MDRQQPIISTNRVEKGSTMKVNYETHNMPNIPGQLWAGEADADGNYQVEGAEGMIHTEVGDVDEIGIHFLMDGSDNADASFFLTPANAAALAASLMDAASVAARWKSQEELRARAETA